MIKLKLFPLLLLFSIPAMGMDFLKCKRENTLYQTRQFCWVDDSPQETRHSISLSLGDKGNADDILSLLLDKKILLSESETEQTVQYLDGLEPELAYAVNWTKDVECSRHDVWNNRVSIVIPNSSNKNEEIFVGHYQDALSLVDGVSYKINQDAIDVSLKFNLVNHDYTFSREHPLPQQRIPAKCKLDIDQVAITYNPLAVARNTESLSSMISTRYKIVVSAFILNGVILDQQKGAFCAIWKLASTLRDVQDLSEAGWGSLSFVAQQGIVAAIEEAVNKNGIKRSEVPRDTSGLPDYWKYFINEKTQKEFSGRCELDKQNYVVSEENFKDGDVITSPAGLENAQAYHREIKNIKIIRNALWAIALVDNSVLEKLKKKKWVLEPIIYENI
ncbi:MAG: hypothetical protein HQK50_11370 [Oligoflexia bacterium]|nr:hypothetical protein [Oligoflexia bacterium]MBF0366164.1 hypothetical protein [Oligoflexia bacterium]